LERRVKIKKDSGKGLRETIANLIANSIVDIRGIYPEVIRTILNNLNANKSNIVDTQIYDIESELFTDSVVNDLLDQAYVDFSIQYDDLFSIQDHTGKIRRLFDSCIMSIVIKSGEIASKARDYLSVKTNQFSFTNTVHESFNSPKNNSMALQQLNINSGAGVLRLGGEENNYCREETCDIILNPISLGIDTIDETDSINAFNDDPTDPYYITCLSYDEPVNPDYGTINFSDNNGLLVDLSINFQGVFPINRISLAPFSNSPIEIINIYYSNIVNPAWSTLDMTEIEINDINMDGKEIEINFDRIYTTEIHIVICQKHYVTSNSEKHIEECINISEYLEFSSSILNNILPNGFENYADYKASLNEVIDDIEEQTEQLSTRINQGARLYTVGTYNVKAMNISYLNYGEYDGEVSYLDGTLSSASIAYDGLSDIYTSGDISSSGVIDAFSVFSIVTSDNKEIYIGQPVNTGTYNETMDVCHISEHMEYKEGDLVQSETYPYKITTHFLPVLDGSYPVYIYPENEQVLFQPTGEEIIWHGTNAEVLLSASFSSTYNLYTGNVAAMRYAIPYYDRSMRGYNITEVDVSNIIGKPNVKDNRAVDINEPYLYVPSGEISNFISYSPDEFYEVHIEGKEDTVYYAIGTGKGEAETADEIIINVDSNLFVSSKYAIFPYDYQYYGAIYEPMNIGSDYLGLEMINSKNYQKWRTDVSYIKGSIKVYINDQIEPDVVEYDNDSIGNIISMENKRIVYVYNPNENQVHISYIPVDITDIGIKGTISTNIATHNNSETFSKTNNARITLSRRIYHDRSIISSVNFLLNDGIFFMKKRYSIFYEPISVNIEGIKAVNITNYHTGNKPTFSTDVGTAEYQYYVEESDKLIFNKEISKAITVQYYTSVDTVKARIRMYRINNYRDDITPEIYNYTMLLNTQKN
jgi:hypothetical protein